MLTPDRNKADYVALIWQFASAALEQAERKFRELGQQRDADQIGAYAHTFQQHAARSVAAILGEADGTRPPPPPPRVNGADANEPDEITEVTGVPGLDNGRRNPWTVVEWRLAQVRAAIALGGMTNQSFQEFMAAERCLLKAKGYMADAERQLLAAENILLGGPLGPR
jgi:predicted dienelactone hydrolase